MNSFIHVPTNYRFRSEAEREAEVAAANQTSATVTKAPPEEAPVNLDTLLDELDSALARFDELNTKAGNFPAEAAAIESRHEALMNQELDSIESIEARSAQASKIIAMREVLTVRQKKVHAAIGAEQDTAIKIGTQIAALLEARWWSNYVKRADEIKFEFERLFYRSGFDQNLQDSYVRIVLLKWMQVPNFNVSRFSQVDVKLAKCRQLRETANKLAEFERMSFFRDRPTGRGPNAKVISAGHALLSSW